MRNTLHQYVRTCPKCQIMNLQRPNIYKPTPRNSTNTTGSLINQLHWTLQYSHTRQHICYHSNLQPHQLPNENPISNKKTTTVAVQLFSEIFLNFSFPRILYSDNRAEFKSKLIEHLAQQLGVKKTYILPTILSQTEN